MTDPRVVLLPYMNSGQCPDSVRLKGEEVMASCFDMPLEPNTLKSIQCINSLKKRT